MKIMLATPPQGLRVYKDNGKQNCLRRGLPPLGMGYIAGLLENNGHIVKIVDAPAFNYSYSDILREIEDFNPALLGISAITPVAKNAYQLIKLAKKAHRQMPIIIGGAHPTCFPRETIYACSELDAVIVGEGEYTVFRIVERIEKGESLEGIPGIYYRNNSGEIIKNSENKEVVDLEKLPFPSRHLYPLSNYLPELFENKRLPSMNIIASRGCAYARCTFCYRSGTMKRVYRCQSPRKTIEEIRLLVNKYKIKELVFYDEDLFSNRGWIDEFCDLMINERFDIIWSCRARADTPTYDALKKAKQAGLWSICCGFESGSQDLLDRIKKGITLGQSRRFANWCHLLGIEITGCFMLALPGEDLQKGLKTIEFAKEIDCEYTFFIPTHPFVGTELYEQCVREGKIIENPYDNKMVATRFIPRITYIPEGYKDKQEIEYLLRKAYREFYLRPKYILKHLRKIKDWDNVKRYADGFLFWINLIKKLSR